MKKIFLFLLVGIFMVSFSSSIEWGNSLDRYYAFNETSGIDIPDYSGQDTNATVFNSELPHNPNTETWVRGKLNNTLYWNGTGTTDGVYARMPNWSFDPTASSINLWLNTTEFVTNTPNLIARSSPTNYLIFINSTRLQFQSNVGGDAINFDFPNSSGIIRNTWMMITVTRSSGTIRAYINASESPTGGLSNSGAYYADFIGRYNAYYTKGRIDEVSLWNRTLSQSDIDDLYNNGAGLSLPQNLSVTLNNPNNNSIGANFTLNFSATINPGLGDNLANATVQIWYLNGTLFNETTNILSGTQKIQTDFNITNIRVGNYTWNVLACDTSFCGSAPSNFSFNVSTFSLNSITQNGTSVETANEGFSINITLTETYTISSATFHYNNIEYSSTFTNLGGDFWNITSRIDIPVGVFNNTFFFSITSNGTTTNTQDFFQSVNETIFVLCNETFSEDYLNITFRDESTLANTNSSVPSATFTYYLGLGTVTKTYTFSNSTLLDHFRFCASPSTRTFNVDPFFQYRQGLLYPQRIWDAAVQLFTNTMTTKILYLLHSDDGIFVTFQVINPSNQVLTGVTINATTLIDGSQTLVANQTTGDSGSITFWLNPDAEHIFSFSKSGFNTLFSTFFPTQSSYTITLGGGGESQTNDYSFGISTTILPSVTTDLVNGTVFDFNMTLTSSFWEVSEYGFNLKMANGTILNSTSTTTTGTTINIKRDTADFSQFELEYYWIINESVQTRNIVYNIRNTGFGEWSISNFFTDLNAYLDEGFFGIDNFGRYFIIFLFFMFGIGILSFKFGLVSPMAVTFSILAVTYLFDAVLGLLPNPVNAIPNFLTFAAGLIFIIAIFREVTK